MNMNKSFLILSILMLNACSLYEQEDVNLKCLTALNELTHESNQIISPEKTNHVESISMDVERVLLIDASLSMNGQVNGKRKIEEVKDMISHFVNNHPHALNDLKVYSFGNAHDGCSNNKILLSEELEDEIKTLKLGSEIGKSPIINSVESIVDEHQERSIKPIEITVISDGVENCLDHETSLQKLKDLKLRSNVDIKLHLVGYNTSQSQNEKLKSLVAVTNGIFLPVKSSIELKERVPALLDGSFGFINVEKPLEINEFTSWKIYNQGKLLASYSDSNFGFDEESPIKIKTGQYGFCLSIGHSVFVRQIKVNNREVSNIKLSTLVKY